jgi:hypothetical protein
VTESVALQLTKVAECGDRCRAVFLEDSHARGVAIDNIAVVDDGGNVSFYLTWK